MTYYLKELARLKVIRFSNTEQLENAIGIRRYINDNFHNELNLDLLSTVHFTSKFHLIRLFKKYYGQTPKQYIIDKRIQASKDLLKKGMKISETCFEVGFESPSSFSTLFKSRVGLTPTEFQRKATFAKSL